ncbi:hypothetical protein ACFO1B_06695 [Dactylosporangium siamense]|uniref:Uncharacterized protein n=1 Tax=Dactylosporangium siamense TaxID=685454 RepID=A0A919PHR6_9ACTN|nr:hypothetical protein [Dactylosporangium siamense]GIG43446.1 hypothetical protein Dsi01nite_014870 [Dactylosporangium siamense]
MVAKLVYDTPDFTYTIHVAGCGELRRGGRLRAWREDDGGLLALLTVAGSDLDDEAGVVADQVRLQLVGERVDVVAYEPSWWGDGCTYLRAVAGTRWEPLDPKVLCDRVGPSFVIDDEADTSPGYGGP